MKKILLATTALVAFAGAGAADVKLSGYAEIGVKDTGSGKAEFHNDIDVKFSLSGTTDNGLSFGATIDLDEVNGSAEVGGTQTSTTCSSVTISSTPQTFTPSCTVNKSTFNSSSVWVSGAFGKITMGDTDGAFDWAMTEVSSLTTIADDHSTHAGFDANSGLDGWNDGQVLRYEYSFGDFSVAVSAEGPEASDTVMGVGVKYSGDLGGVKIGVGLGYQKWDTIDIAGISVSAKMDNGFSVVVNYSDYDSSYNHTAIGIGYTTGALSLEANYGSYSDGGDDGYGLAMNYDLGGGAVVMAGYGHDDYDDYWSVGLGLSF
jgi:outer membrane protein OmpU